MYRFLINVIVVPYLLNMGYAERTKDKMYDKISATTACYRRLNATHQTGCSSKRQGSTGVVHFCENIEDLNYILSNGTAPPYIPILPTKYFNRETVEKMIKSDKVSGLVLFSNNDTLTHFTHEYECPNSLSGYNDSCPADSVWNPYGTGLLYADIPFPIFYAEDEEEILKIRQCFNQFNNYSYENQADRSLCSLELKSFMLATTNTLTCRRRSNIVSNLNPVKFCDPLGDNNIWASLFPLVVGPKNETTPLKGFKYIIIAARMDTTSMFEKTAGANNPISAIVTLLSVAKFLKEALTADELLQANRHILFMIFNGETYDYIGSQRMLYDMINGNFPVEGLPRDNNILPIIEPEDISLFIELSQLGNSKKSLYVHYLEDKDFQINKFYKNLQNNNFLIDFKNIPQSLPPASLHTFLKHKRDFPGLIIADHEMSYTNHFYNSLFDDASNIGFEYYKDNVDDIPMHSIQYFVANLSVTIGTAVYKTVKNETFVDSYSAKQLVPLVNELFQCYLKDAYCKVQNATHFEGRFPKSYNLYVGVDHVTNYASTFTALALGWLTGDVVNKSENCTNKPRNYAFKYYNMSKSLDELNVTVCYKITMNMTDAISPAFIIKDYDWTSGLYSSWAESTWPVLNVRMFLKPSLVHEKMTIALGSVTVIFSFLLVYFINSRSHILFTSPLPTEAPTDC